MATKKITLNELRSLVKHIIKEEGIGMFHDPRMITSFKDENDKWENGVLWVRIKMLKNIIGIKDDEIAKINAIRDMNQS